MKLKWPAPSAGGRSALHPLLLLTAGVLVIGLAVAALAVLQRPPSAPDRLTSSSVPERSLPEPLVEAPAAEVQRVHEALHDIGTQCGLAATGSPLRIDGDVEDILAFASRYPEGRFPIDDETGTALSLLLVTREALRDCAPAAAARVDRVLPGEFRDGP